CLVEPRQPDFLALVGIAVVREFVGKVQVAALRGLVAYRYRSRCSMYADIQSLPGHVVAVGIGLRRKSPSVRRVVVDACRQARTSMGACRLMQFASRLD